MKDIGLIGYGTIGKYLADNLLKERLGNIRFIYDPFIKGKNKLPAKVVENLGEEDLKNVDFVIEAAISDVVKQNALHILKYTNMLVFSVTSMADEDFYKEVIETCHKYNTKLYIPHGAIVGLDGIFDGKAIIKKVKITTIKNPKSLGREDKTKTVLYEDNARGACFAYPRNVNVHAGIALAGIGFDKTQSMIISDPEVTTNSHIIEIEGEGIDFEIKVVSKPVGMVTGAYTPASAFGSVRRIISSGSGIQIV